MNRNSYSEGPDQEVARRSVDEEHTVSTRRDLRAPNRQWSPSLPRVCSRKASPRCVLAERRFREPTGRATWQQDCHSLEGGNTGDSTDLHYTAVK